LQQFLKTNSFVLHQSAESISKQKLGEDFITDFVLVSATTQGPTYILVELERSSYPVLTQELVLSSSVIQAIKQTADWDVWLENNKAYIKNKLPGFETPQYIVIIGRSRNFSPDQYAHLRSYNRRLKNLGLLTYDDVLFKYRATIEKLKSAIAK
jgi:hypothetical protein